MVPVAKFSVGDEVYVAATKKVSGVPGAMTIYYDKIVDAQLIDCGGDDDFWEYATESCSVFISEEQIFKTKVEALSYCVKNIIPRITGLVKNLNDLIKEL